MTQKTLQKISFPNGAASINYFQNNLTREILGIERSITISNWSLRTEPLRGAAAFWAAASAAAIEPSASAPSC